MPSDWDIPLMKRSYEGYVERFQRVEQRLEETKAFVTGEHFTVADVVLGVEVCRFSCGLHRWAKERRELLPALTPLPALAEYFKRLQERSGFHEGCLRHERKHQQMESL